MYSVNPPAIKAGSIEWQKIGGESDPAARLLSHIRIAGVDMHLEAWALADDSDDQAVVDATSRADDFETLCGMMDCRFEPAEIDGRDYFLIATPYGK